MNETEDLIKRSRQLLNDRKGQLLLRQIPQGPGSGLHADLLDGLHAEDIIEKCMKELEDWRKKGVPTFGGRSQGLIEHGNQYHDPPFAVLSEYEAHIADQDAHHRKWSWADEDTWRRTLRIPYAAQEDWVKSDNNPLYAAVERYGICALRMNDQVWIYNSQMVGISQAICLIRSDELEDFSGATKTTVFQGRSGKWDEAIVGFSAFYDSYETDTAKRFKAIYCGMSGSVYQLGYAWSADGITWSRRNSALSGITLYQGFNKPSFYRIGRLYYLTVFEESQGPLVLYVSKNCVNWSRLGEVVLKGSTGKWDDTSIYDATLHFFQGTFFMLYVAQGTGAPTGFAVGMSISQRPLITFEKYELNPILAVGPADEWDDQHIYTASMIQFDDDYYLYYIGRKQSTGDEKLGVAKLRGAIG